MSYAPINFQQKFGMFDELWQPKVIAELNDYQFKMLLIEPRGVPNTGRGGGERTAQNDVWI